MARGLACLSGCIVLAATGEAAAETRQADLLIFEGGLPIGAPTTVANVFFPNAAEGRVAISGTLSGGEAFVFIDDRIVWVASDALPTALTSIDSAMGSQGIDAFVIRANADGTSALWTDAGPLVLSGDPLPDPTLGSFNGVFRPTMDAAGGLSFRAIINAEDGGSSSDSSTLFRSSDGTFENLAPLLRSATTVDGVLLDDGTNATDNDFAISDDGLHFVSVASAEGSSSTNGLLIVDETVLAREGDLIVDDAVSWQNFDRVSINNTGDVLFSGDDSGPSTTDEFIAFNDGVQVREGDTLDGTGVVGSMRQVSLSNDGHAAFTWMSSDTVSNQRVAFFACDAGDIASTAQLVLAVGDTLDIDADGTSDVTVTEIFGTASDPGRILSDDLALYLEVDLDPGDVNAIIRLPVSCCGDGVLQDGEVCDDDNDDNTDACPASCEMAVCGDGFVQSGVDECDDGNQDDTDACLTTCEDATCGDGIVWAGVEGCDDGDDDDTDACPATCQPATCGDGFVHAGVEDCDDGNNEDGDGCDASCVEEAPEGTTGTGGTGGTTDASTTDPSGSGSTGDRSGSTSTGRSESSGDGDDTTGGTGSAADTTSTGGLGDSTTSPAVGEDSSGGSSGGEAAGASDDEGCSCVAGEPPHGLAWTLCLAMLGLRRRRVAGR